MVGISGRTSLSTTECRESLTQLSDPEIVLTDYSDADSVKTVKDSRDDLKHRATAINEGKRAGGERRPKPNTEGRKALKKYKIALKTELLLGSKAVC